MAEITNELLKRAVADAEAVRETAIANAKLALEESITPAIKSMLAKRLRAEAEKPAEELPAPEGEKEVEKKEADADTKEMKHEELDSSDVSADNKEPSGFETSDIGQEGEEAPEDAPESEDDWYEDWDESDFDLDEVLKELEGDISEDSLFEKSDEEEKEGDDEEMKESSHEDEKEPKEEGWNGEAKTVDLPKKEEPKHDSEEGKEEDKLDLEAIIRELVAEADDEEEGDEDHGKMAAEIAELKAELSEYQQAVKMLSSKLQEVHLLNSKLLYTNKLFQKGKLTNEQTVRVIESFDRAKTLREVKMVYALMVENLKAIRVEGRVPSRKAVVTEGLASRPTPSTAPKNVEQLQENTTIKRLQYLAGINN
jgi:hypothetical protein